MYLQRLENYFDSQHWESLIAQTWVQFVSSDLFLPVTQSPMFAPVPMG